MLTVRLLGLVVAGVVTVGCALSIGARSLQVTVPGDGLRDPLPITLEDRTGWVTGLSLAPPDDVADPNGDPARLVVTWLGGLCDVATRLSLETGPQDTLRLLVRTERHEGCLLAGVERTVLLEFDRSIAAAQVEILDLDLPGDRP
jgi:hypothetical protein